LSECLAAAGVSGATAYASVAQACVEARECAGENDKIVVFGSFHTVAEAMQAMGVAQ
jgi:dihydrofolate synthase / folylpolyglutamate synthase